MNSPGVFVLGEAVGADCAETVRTTLRRNDRLMEILHQAAELNLPGWYIAAGCLTQTVWNYRTGRPLETGIRDYDLIYFDASNTSWAAENEAIAAMHSLVADLPVTVEVRNQARVHLWYEQRFGKPCPPYRSTESAIDTFPTTATSIGVRLERAGHWRFYAPFGFTDLLDLVVRPNTALAPREVYEQKAQRWRERWPELRVLPWS